TTEFYCAGENQAVITALAHSFLSRLGERTFAIAGAYETADPYGKTPFHVAAAIDDRNTLRWLIHHGIPIDSCNEKGGWSALMCAAQGGCTESADFLIAKGANVDVINPKDGFSSLMYAAQNDHPDMVRLLIQKRADLDSRNHGGWTALAIAAFRGHTAIVDLLLQHRADPRLYNLAGFSALMAAAQNGHTDCVNLFIQYGAELNQRNQNGYSAAMLAMENQHEEIAIMLFNKAPDSILNIQAENIDIDHLLNLHQHLFQVMIDYMFTQQYAFYNKIDPFKRHLENCFTMSLFLGNHSEKSHKAQIIKLYIVLRDDRERNEGELIANNANIFFNTRYMSTVRNFNSIFRKECTYSEKRKAALQLLAAVENDEHCPQHRALEEGQLGKIAAICFPNKENKVEQEYSSSASRIVMRGA
ncbi:MAG: ankyrin repeat domain-containing protein, partial [Gammaproteobacteria bacterium]|nr:ankyrin repeat domain-containing protein [Gammaproteobacteria bacterium]